MSQKNSEGKRSARERLQEQRRQEESRTKRKRTLIAAVVVVAVLGAGAGIAALVAGGGKDDKKKTAGPLVAPQGATGKDTVTIPVGKPDAKSTLTVYEDFRCPGCGQFEMGFRDTVRDLEAKGLLKTDYHLVTLIDGNLRGSGSLNAANAAACAQDAGKFAAYHDLLFKNQPQETDDAYGKKSRLIELAGRIPGLDTPAFRKCVEDGTHDSWVKKSHEAFSKSSYHATPTVLLNGKDVYGDQANPLTPDKLREMVTAKAKG
ncbi:membrane protein [Streptomyces eurocidicus]|uniref:Membrane protein n=1 Tax=Streptomyces eurocidicus TaxID=66423 RepID=A0A2N8P1P7_STREU|nr:thioredoxin domain-containing protein [Streptomyces eurocidicus]MBB5118486.1 protein-disulfide isomerase [Streptomyces eurocidicus]MBF6051938.1 thioredoxin domain-containing protein [Streptomyces eurocidicus]PNE34937.1 membrane protein [Streptomyces eurocidicus]